MMNSRVGRMLAAGAGVYVAALPQAIAQTQTAAAKTRLDEVVVTAQRREELVKDTPVSVTVLQGSDLEARQINDVRALYSIAPSLTVATGAGDSNDLGLGLRGISLTNNAIVVDPTVGVYYDGVYLARTTGANVGMIDMERIEVLRGPQGTLFGRNTIGGALNITTKKPTGLLEGWIKAGIGNYNLREVSGALNVPILDDVLAARVVLSHSTHDGYAENTFLDQDMNDGDYDYGRAHLLFTPNDRVELLVSYDWYMSHANSQMFRLNYIGGAPLGPTLAPYYNNDGDFYKVNANFQEDQKSKVDGVASTLTVDLDALTLKYIASYRDQVNDRNADLDGSPVAAVDFHANDFDGDQMSHELQLIGDALDGDLEWITGLYYFNESGENGIITTRGPFLSYNVLPDAENTSKSVFGQATYELMEDLRLTLGARYVKDRREILYSNYLVSPAGAVTCALPVSLNQGDCLYRAPNEEFSYKPWTVGLDYKPTPDILLYGKISKGYRSGGFPLTGGSRAAQFDPFDAENLLSQEVGAKFDMLNGKLRMDLSFYHSSYKDIQQNENTIDPDSGAVVQTTLNVGTAEIWGSEVELSALIGDLRLGAALGLIDPEYTDGPQEGEPAVVTAEQTWSLNADYPITLPVGALNLHADYSYRSEVNFYATAGLNPAQTDAVSQKGYALLNAMVSWKLPNPALTMSLWGKNLSDKEFYSRTMNFTANGFNVGMIGEPRTFGASAEYRF